MKSSVFSRCLNVLKVAADVTGTGRLFRAVATGKARSPTVERRVGGTIRALVVADRSYRRVSRVETGCYSPPRYGGARTWRQ